MNAVRHLVRLVTTTIVGTLAVLVLHPAAAWAGPAPLDQTGGPSPQTAPTGDGFWDGTSIGLAVVGALVVIALVSVLMVATVRHHDHGAPAPV